MPGGKIRKCAVDESRNRRRRRNLCKLRPSSLSPGRPISKISIPARSRREARRSSVLLGERQHFLEQFIGKFLLLFKKREMACIVKPDEFRVGSLDGLAVLSNQGRRAVRIVPPLKEQDWCPEVEPEFSEINFHHFGHQYVDGELRAMDPAVVIDRGIFWC